MGGKKRLGERISDHGDGLGKPEFLLGHSNIIKPAVALRFESRAEIPEAQAGIHFALTLLLIQELRRAKRQTGFTLQVDAAPLGSRTRDKPALVESATRNGERSS